MRTGTRRHLLSYAPVAVAAPVLTYKERVLATSPLAYWTLEEPDDPSGYATISDYSGNGYDGSAEWYTPGTNGLGFTGIGDGLTCWSSRIDGDTSAYINALSGHFPGDEGAMQAWFKYVGDPGATNPCIVLSFSKNYQFSRGLWITNNGTVVRATDKAVMHNQGYPRLDVSVLSEVKSITPVVADLSVWHCYLAQWSVANNYLKLYVDGVLAGTEVGLTGITGGQSWAGDSGGDSWGIGGDPGSYERQAGGHIAHVAVWNSLLPPGTIVALGAL